MNKKIQVIASLVAMIFLTACSAAKHVTRYDESTTISDPKKGRIVGLFSEGFLMQPHLAMIFFKGQNIADEYGGKTAFGVSTRGKSDAIADPNILGQYFAIEVPPGNYNIDGWTYFHFRGNGVEPVDPFTFEVKPGETIYIGNIHAVALNMCLKFYNHYNQDVPEIRKHFPLLAEGNIIDASQDFDKREWPHESYADIAEPGHCATIEQLLKE